MLGRSKRTSKKAARKSFAETKMARAAKRVGREISYVGLGISAGALSTVATAATVGAIAGTGQVIADATRGGATATVREKGLFKKEKEVKLSEMKSLKKYKTVQMHGLHDKANLETFGKVTAVGSLGVGTVTGFATHGIIRNAVEDTIPDNRRNLSRGDITPEEAFEEILEEEEA